MSYSASEDSLTTSVVVVLENLQNLDNCAVLKNTENLLNHLWIIYSHEEIVNAFVSSLSSPKHAEEFLCSCFENLCHKDRFHLTLQVLTQCGIEVLKKIALSPGSELAKTVFNIILMQLLQTENKMARNVTELMLQSSDLYVYKAITELLYDVLKSGKVPNPVQYSCQNHVYDVIYELLKISKSLVTELMGHCALSLSCSRPDHLPGMKFLFKLFVDKSLPRLWDPAVFYSRLWNLFVSHYRRLRLQKSISVEEVQLILEYTPQILNRQSLSKDWCMVLLSRIECAEEDEIEVDMIKAILDALKPYARVLRYNDSESEICVLLRTLLDPSSRKLSSLARKHLYEGLGEIYCSAVESFLNNEPVLILEFGNNSALLKLLLGICSLPTPSNRDWCLLQGVFVKYCVPRVNSDEERCEMLFQTWLCAEEYQHVLESLLRRASLAHHCLKALLDAISNQDLSSTIAASNKLSSFLLRQDLGAVFISETLVNNIKGNHQLQQMLTRLTADLLPYKDAINLIDQIEKMIPVEKNQEINKSTFFSLFSINPRIENCFENFLECVDTCIYSEDVGVDGSQRAVGALRLLQEVLILSLHLNFTKTFVRYLFKWSQHSDSEISVCALRCLLLMKTVQRQTLESWDSECAKEFLDDLLKKMCDGSKGQVKMALRCYIIHSASYNVAENTILKIISQQVTNILDVDKLERGFAALGALAFCCSSVLKPQVQDLAMQNVRKLILEDFELIVDISPPNISQSDSFPTDWNDLPLCGRLMVRALRSLGRCTRCCGNLQDAVVVLVTLESIITGTVYTDKHNFTTAEIDWLWLEAACAILNIMENSKFHSLIPRCNFGALSSMMTDRCAEVRKIFAEKLCSGLKPHKFLSTEPGQRKGSLPLNFFGFLPLLGIEFSASTDHILSRDKKQWAKNLVLEVFLSRNCRADHLRRVTDSSLKGFFKKMPEFLHFHALVYAIPILADLLVKSSDIAGEPVSFSSVTVDEESLKQVAFCFALIIGMLQSPQNSVQVSKNFLMKAIELGRGHLKRPADDILFKKYLAVCEVLKFVGKFYKPRKNCLNPKSIKFTDKYFGDTSHDRINFAEQFTNNLKKRMDHDLQTFFSEEFKGNQEAWKNLELEDKALLYTTFTSATESEDPEGSLYDGDEVSSDSSGSSEPYEEHSSDVANLFDFDGYRSSDSFSSLSFTSRKRHFPIAQSTPHSAHPLKRFAK